MDTHLDTALLTVEQAKDKWCPEARSENTTENATAAVNRTALGRPDTGAGCLGDACAFWRWHDRAERPQKHAAVSQATWIDGHIDGSGEWYPGDFTDAPRDGRDWEIDTDEGYWYIPSPPLPLRGYCGKVGHPHAAALVEAQLELLRYQLHDHRRAA